MGHWYQFLLVYFPIEPPESKSVSNRGITISHRQQQQLVMALLLLWPMEQKPASRFFSASSVSDQWK